jgi:hypothetical protein
MFSSLHTRVRSPLRLLYMIFLFFSLYSILFRYIYTLYFFITLYIYIADWCNSNITGSCPVYIGANPLSAFFFSSKNQYIQGYSLIGKASCSWQLRWVFKSLWPYLTYLFLCTFFTYFFFTFYMFSFIYILFYIYIVLYIYSILYIYIILYIHIYNYFFYIYLHIYIYFFYILSYKI